MKIKALANLLGLYGLIALLLGCQPVAPSSSNNSSDEPSLGAKTAASSQSYGIVVTAEQVTAANLAQWKATRSPVVLKIDSVANHQQDREAALAIDQAELQLDYFIEVARCPELAAQHPEWMASLQGHPGWRTQFPDLAQPTARQVIKNQPWVPILYRESFDAHVARIQSLLKDKPPAKRIWLNDLQGAPSACGCGHPLCRWTADYGPIKTATPLDQNAAAEFVAAVRQLSAGAEIIPIFVGECEEEDKHTVCCGVACFEGKCWKEFTKQLDAVAKTSPTIGVACFYREFNRDLPRYDKAAGWIDYTLDSFSTMPAKRDGVGVPAGRLIAVLQGWDVSSIQLESQIERVKETEAIGYLVALCPIDQNWQPVVFDLPASVVTDKK
jgi:hypothetical protein